MDTLQETHPPQTDTASEDMNDELRPEYDIKSLRIRSMGPGRKSFGNAVALDPDVAAIFDTPEAVNAALRFLIKVTRQPTDTPAPPLSPPAKNNV